jgi:hypothetical protein
MPILDYHPTHGRMGQRRAFAMGGGGGGRGRFPALHAPAVCAVDSRMYVFGGKLPAAPELAGKRDEDGYHAWERCSADLYALDMQTWTWTCVSDEATGYDTAQLQDNTHQVQYQYIVLLVLYFPSETSTHDYVFQQPCALYTMLYKCETHCFKRVAFPRAYLSTHLSTACCFTCMYRCN